MLFNVALSSTLCIVPAVVAFLPNNHIGQDGAGTDVLYSTNWAGAVWAEGNGTFSYVTGTFTVPTPTGVIGDSATAWVGIDGDTCQSAILQTGVAFTVEQGQPNYYAWYEWYPAPSYNFSGIAISAGDNIKLTVTATTATSGVATVENLTNGQRVFKGITSSAPLCGQNAEWIVEDYAKGPSITNMTLVPFADFGTVTFTSAAAGLWAGTKSYTPSGATIVDIKQNGSVLTSVSTSGSSVTIQYV